MFCFWSEFQRNLWHSYCRIPKREVELLSLQLFGFQFELRFYLFIDLRTENRTLACLLFYVFYVEIHTALSKIASDLKKPLFMRLFGNRP